MTQRIHSTGTLPTTLSSTALVGSGTVVMDANDRRARRVSRASKVLLPILWVAVTMTLGVMFKAWAGLGWQTFDIAASFLTGVLLFGVAIGLDYEPHSRVQTSSADPDAVEAAMAMLIYASVHGLRPSERRAVQRAIDDASETLAMLAGADPWVAGVRGGPASVPAHLAMRGDKLAGQAPRLINMTRRAMRRGGVTLESLQECLSHTVPLIAALATDFGLDPRGFAPPRRPLAGQASPVKDERSVLSAPVRRLIAEWRNGGTVGTSPSSIAADDAARDLDTLETAWEAARANSDASFAETVDEQYARACDALAATLADGIADRARASRDELSTQTRYVLAKHGNRIDDAFMSS